MTYIPKIIHACWFGSTPPAHITKNIQLWKDLMPEWSIFLYTDKDKHLFNGFASQAWHQKKYAFAADYVRCKKLYETGGIALNASTIILRPLDEILDNDNPKFFTGWEVFRRQFTPFISVFGSKPNSFIVRTILEEYNSEDFLINNGTTLNYKTINERFSSLLYQIDPTLHQQSKYKKKDMGDQTIIYPVNYFCIDDKETNICLSPYNGSWLSAGSTKPLITFSIGRNTFQVKKFKPHQKSSKPDKLTHETIIINIKNRILISRFQNEKESPVTTEETHDTDEH